MRPDAATSTPPAGREDHAGVGEDDEVASRDAWDPWHTSSKGRHAAGRSTAARCRGSQRSQVCGPASRSLPCGMGDARARFW